MSEVIGVVVLFLGLLFGWNVAGKVGFWAPASVYIWFLNLDLALFLIIAFAHLSRQEYTFTAMLWSDFEYVIVPTAMIYGILFLAGWFSVWGLQKTEIKSNRLKISLELSSRVKNIFSLVIGTLLVVIFLLELFHFIEIDKSMLWRNNQYLLLNNPFSAGIDTLVGRIIHLSLRPLGLLLIGAATYFWVHRTRKIALILLVLSIYPFLLSYAQNSRWAPLYIGGIMVVLFYGKKNKGQIISVLFWGILFFFLFIKVLLGRNTPYQGLSGGDKIITMIFSNLRLGRWLLGFIVNFFQGAQNLANSMLIQPVYPEIYKVLSFSPTISAIDKFEIIRRLHMVKINPVVPMNAYSEAYFFGVFYFMLYVIIIFAWLKVMTKLLLYHNPIVVGFMPFVYWIILSQSQYAIRNSMRLVYISLLIGLIIIRFGDKKGESQKEALSQL